MDDKPYTAVELALAGTANAVDDFLTACTRFTRAILLADDRRASAARRYRTRTNARFEACRQYLRDTTAHP